MPPREKDGEEGKEGARGRGRRSARRHRSGLIDVLMMFGRSGKKTFVPAFAHCAVSSVISGYLFTLLLGVSQFRARMYSAY